MNAIYFKRPISAEEYAMLTRVVEAIGIEVQDSQEIITCSCGLLGVHDACRDIAELKQRLASSSWDDALPV